MSICSFSFAGIGLGLRAGVNFATQDAKLPSVDDLSISSITGFVGGVYFNAMFGDGKIGIQPEILYSTKGSTYNFTYSGINENGEDKLKYIDIPILFRWQLIKLLNLQVGPQFSILADAARETDGNTEDIMDELKNSEMSLVIGAEVNLPFRLDITARYIYGLTDISEISEVEITNSALQLTLAFRILGE